LRLHPQLLAVGKQRQGSVQVGAQDGASGQPVQDGWVGAAAGVNRDERQARVQGFDPGGAGGAPLGEKFP